MMVGTMEQLSLFDLAPLTGAFATCCGFDHKRLPAEDPEDWMKELVPDGRYVVRVGAHPLVLRPTKLTESKIPAGHHYYHYTVSGMVYAGVFVGRCDVPGTMEGC